MGQDTENWVGDHDIGSTGRAVSSVLQMPGVFVQVQYFLAVLHVEFSFRKFSPIAPAEMNNTQL